MNCQNMLINPNNVVPKSKSIDDLTLRMKYDFIIFSLMTLMGYRSHKIGSRCFRPNSPLTGIVTLRCSFRHYSYHLCQLPLACSCRLSCASSSRGGSWPRKSSCFSSTRQFRSLYHHHRYHYLRRPTRFWTRSTGNSSGRRREWSRTSMVGKRGTFRRISTTTGRGCRCIDRGGCRRWPRRWLGRRQRAIRSSVRLGGLRLASVMSDLIGHEVVGSSAVGEERGGGEGWDLVHGPEALYDAAVDLSWSYEDEDGRRLR